MAGTGLSGAVANDVLIRTANVVESFLKAGVPLSKIDHHRPLLESNYCRMTYSTHMAQLVPFLLQNEQSTIKKEIASAAHLTVFISMVLHALVRHLLLSSATSMAISTYTNASYVSLHCPKA